eukprot:1151356-Pelagomonas_calceolata.AAC.2
MAAHPQSAQKVHGTHILKRPTSTFGSRCKKLWSRQCAAVTTARGATRLAPAGQSEDNCIDIEFFHPSPEEQEL